MLTVLKKSATDAIKTASKRAIQKTTEATGDLIGNKIADKITSFSKNFSKEWHLLEFSSNEANNEIPKESMIEVMNLTQEFISSLKKQEKLNQTFHEKL